MSVFEVGRMVTARQCAERYNVRFARNGRAYCPFHAGGMEKHPALSFKDGGFNCFACGEKGDSIAFVAKLMGMSMLQAAQTINEDFGCGLDDKAPDDKQKREYAKQQAAQRMALQKRKFAEDIRDWALLQIRMDEAGSNPAGDWSELNRKGLMDILRYRAELEYAAEENEVPSEKVVNDIAAVREAIYDG